MPKHKKCTWNTINAIATLLMAFATFAMAIVASRSVDESKKSSHSNMLISLSQCYESREMRELRAKTAADLLQNNYDSADNVLNFFSLVGIIVRSGGLEKELAWRMFFNDLHPYYLVLKNYIDEQREKDPRVYESVIQLDEDLSHLDTKVYLDSWSDSNKIKFLEDEKNLLGK